MPSLSPMVSSFVYMKEYSVLLGLLEREAQFGKTTEASTHVGELGLENVGASLDTQNKGRLWLSGLSLGALLWLFDCGSIHLAHDLTVFLCNDDMIKERQIS